MNDKIFKWGKAFVFCPVLLTLLMISNNAFSIVSILKATGGAISADKAENASSPSYTTIGNIRITEGGITNFSLGTNVTFTINAPAGWKFNTAAAVTVTHVNGRDISTSSVLSKTTTDITIQLTVGGLTKLDILTVAAIQIRPDEGANVPGTTNLTSGGTATISGCPAGTNLGDLSETAGVVNRLVLTLPGLTFTDGLTLAGSGITGTATSRISGTSYTITRISACDQFYNVVPTYTGVKTISYSGPLNGLTAPSYTTSVNFTNGLSTTTLTTTLKKTETTTLTVTDGSVTGLTSPDFVVNPGVTGNYLVEATGGGSIGSQIAGTAFNIKITARDAENNICNAGPNVFTGTVDLTSSGTLSSGGGTTAVFTSGVLASKSVTISNTGNFTITATRTSGIETGVSNTFAVSAGVVNNFLVESSSGGNIGIQVVDTSFNIKISARDANNNICRHFLLTKSFGNS